jgi:GNAT superfamily N-acetyltransferase
MAMELADLGPEPPVPAGIDPGPISADVCAELNDLAYGYGPDGFRAGLAGETSIRWHGAFDGAAPTGCVGAIEIGEDCCITGVATPPERRGRGIASWLLWRALAEARELGLTTASLQATQAGAPLYERLGFRDLGFIEMWELRR